MNGRLTEKFKLEKDVDVTRLHRELQAAGLPVTGVDSSGKVCLARELTADERARLEGALAAHDPAPDAAQAWLADLAAQGVTLEQVVHALWLRAQGAPQAFEGSEVFPSI